MSHTAHKASDQRREELIEAALAIIAEFGVSELTTQALSQRIGLVPSAIYRHFRNMPTLLDAVVDTIFARLDRLITQAEADSQPGLDCLHALFRSHLTMIRRYPGIPMLIFSREACAGTPKRRAQVLAGITAFRHRVAVILQQAAALGEIDRDLDVESMAVFYLGLVQPAALLQMLGDTAWDIERHAEFVWPRFRAALGARKVLS